MNPFQVLGLRPEVMKDLSDQQVFHLARFMHRELQRVFHPDTQGSGDAKKSIQINQAMELVDLDTSPASFARFRQEYLKQAKPRQSQIVSSLSSEVEVLTHTTEMLKASFLNYLEGVVYQDKLTVFNAQDVELEMSNTEWIINPAGQDSMRAIGRKTSEPTPSLFRLVIDKKGNKVAYFDSSHKKPKGTKIEEKLIGAISSQELRAKDLGIRDLFIQAGLVSTPDWAPISNTFRARSSSQANQPKLYQCRDIPVGSFELFLQFINPEIAKDSFIFTIKDNAEGPSFSLLGQIIKAKRAGIELT